MPGQSVGKVTVWSVVNESQCGQCGDGHQGSTRGTETVTLKRMADRDVSFNGEPEHQQRTEVGLG